MHEQLENRFFLSGVFPAANWSSYLGGTGSDIAEGVAVDAFGNTWVTGRTSSPGLAVGGFDNTLGGVSDAFVARVRPNGTLDWISFLGGDDLDYGKGIAVDASGDAWVAGETYSNGWVSGGYDTVLGGARDGFIAKIRVDGSLAWSSYIGGAANDYSEDIAVDEFGYASIVGFTSSSGWTTGGFDITFNSSGQFDGYLARVDAGGSLAWSTYIGGNAGDTALGVDIDDSGASWVTGETYSSGWVSGGFDVTHDLGADGFVLKASQSGDLAWSSFIGGNDYDAGSDVATDAAGNGWVIGGTRAANWVQGGFDTTHNGQFDGFIARISSTGATSQASYIGGSNYDYLGGISIGADGSIFVVGETDSPGWVSGGFDVSLAGEEDLFVARINSITSLAWSSYIGGAATEFAPAISSYSGQLAIAGGTASSGLVSGGFDTSFGGGSYDGFVFRIDDDTTPPTVVTTEFDFESSPNRILVTFSEDVSISVSSGDLQVQFFGGGAVSVQSSSYNSVTNTAQFALPISLFDGNYHSFIAAGSINDRSGNATMSDAIFDFFILAGDANRDRTVDISDFAILAARFNLPGTFSQGDFNYDGVADIGDFAILASKFNTTLSAPSDLPLNRTSTALPSARTAPIWNDRRVIELVDESTV